MLFNEENKIKPIKGLVLITSLLLLTILIRKDADKKISGKQATRKQTYWMHLDSGVTKYLSHQ